MKQIPSMLFFILAGITLSFAQDGQTALPTKLASPSVPTAHFSNAGVSAQTAMLLMEIDKLQKESVELPLFS